MTDFFPEIGREELFCSAVARWCKIVNAPSERYVANELFGRRRIHVRRFAFPHHIANFVASLPEGVPITADDIIDNHSQFGYFTLLFSESQKRMHRAEMAAGPRRMKINYVFKDAAASALPDLRFCEECARDDLMRLGQYTWKRVHQLPGVLICPIHSRTLRVAENTRHIQSFRELALTEVMITRSRPLDIPQGYHGALFRIAEMSQWILDQNGLQVNAVLGPRYRNILIKAGWDFRRTRVATAKVWSAIESRYSKEMLECIGCAVPSSREGWIMKILNSNSNEYTMPLGHLILMEFLGVRPNHILQNGGAECERGGVQKLGAEVSTSVHAICKNPFCKCYRAEEDTGESRKIREYCCEMCGFQCRARQSGPLEVLNPGRTWLSELMKLVEGKNLTLQAISKRLDVSSLTVKRYAYGAGIWRKHWGLRKVTRSEQPRTTKAREKHRRIWAHAKERGPQCSRRSIASLFPGTYIYLLQHDREWLDKISPLESSRRSSVDWRAREQDLSERLEKFLQSLRRSDVRPVPLTREGIRRGLNLRSFPKSQIEAHMPMFAQAVDRALDTKRSFTQRRAEWATQEVLSQGVLPSFSDYVRMVGTALALRGPTRDELRTRYEDLRAQLA